ncbi:GNAT superfamily N-acetyltransferase [Actinoplanes tereljensis]|uniref:N-acetyltransferase domain-containing protein n=1 Tax=Paractinoplanes tereljensis TaxID=571912 RepID=A0A919NRG2_9ACTN|nr:GNAT family N-acetyltransferase [Actinoplanes tereljensis]GIF23725.1 hypothetical protein Ate02nite_64550 [Actinoplanes tereljensis]
MGEVSIRFLEGDADAGALRTLYEKVIAPSFLPAEREPIEKLSRVLRADELRGAIAVTPDGEPVGALFLEWFPDIRAALLCYFSIRPDLRGQGIGRRLVSVAAPHWRETLKPLVVFAEAEDPTAPTEVPATADYGDDTARLRLYAGFGARRLPLPYLMPELSPGEGRLPGLLLLVIESDKAVSPTPDQIESKLVEGFLTRYFTRLEGTNPPDDDRLTRLLTDCRRTDFLPLLNLSAAREEDLA